jgi:hypothetical protein
VAEPVIRIDGDEVTVGKFTFVDSDIAEFLEAESKDNRTKIVRDAVIVGMKVMLDQRVSLSTESVLDRVETRINEILTDPKLQAEGSPFARLLEEFELLKKEVKEKRGKQKYSSHDKGDTYEEYVESLLQSEFGFSAQIIRTGTKRASKNQAPRPGDFRIRLNTDSQNEVHFAIEAKDVQKRSLGIEDVKRDTERTIMERKVPVVIWALSKEPASRLIQFGAIDWSIDLGYVLVEVDREQPEQARPLLGAAVRVAQMVYQWQSKVDQQFDVQSAHDFFGKIRTRLLKISKIREQLNIIGSAHKEAEDLSKAVFEALRDDVKDFAEKLEPNVTSESDVS